MPETTTDDRPEWLKISEIAKGNFNYDGLEYSYSILSKELEPSLPGFLGFIQGKYLFISEEVPEDFRILQLIHEIIEFTQLYGQPGRCLQALKIELEIVPTIRKKEYFDYRKNFFYNLVNFYKNSDLAEFKAEIKASYDYLLSLQG